MQCYCTEAMAMLRWLEMLHYVFYSTATVDVLDPKGEQYTQYGSLFVPWERQISYTVLSAPSPCYQQLPWV